MNTATARVLRVERVDDIPVLFALVKQLGVAELLDGHFPRHHLWKGDLTFGEVVATWLTHMLSQGDHRLYHVQPWAQQHLHTLEACLGKTVRPLDFQDDRLADVLDTLADTERWQNFETDLNRNTIRVYDLKPHRFRIDTTTASSYAKGLSEGGILQFGHSKDNDGLPQLKIAGSVLDPLGLPITTAVVPGHNADDPLYVPEMKKVNATFGPGGKTFFGDCKMASLDTRAYVVSTADWYVCPLSQSQLSHTDRLAVLAAVFSGEQKLEPVYRPADPGHEPELVAEGFRYDVELSAEIDGRRRRWKERRWVVQSRAFAQSQAENLEVRLEKAITQLEQLNERKQGKKRLTAQQTSEAGERIIQKQRVEGLLDWQVKTTTCEKVVRGYGNRPEQTVRDEEHRVEISRRVGAIAQAKREMGWQVYATNNLKLNLVGVVWGYRGQYQIEAGWSRLKGCPLSLTPMYLATESRMQGLVLLLSLAVRALTLLEWVVRRKLQESGETLKGVYPSQPGRQTKTPSAEMLLKVFRGLSLTQVQVEGQVSKHVTPLDTLQKRLLELWGFPDDLFQRLTLHCPKPPPQLSEP